MMIYHLLTEIKSDDISWSDKLQEFLLNDSCPNFVKAEIERAKLGDNNVKILMRKKSMMMMVNNLSVLT
jgi:hypothetical protein